MAYLVENLFGKYSRRAERAMRLVARFLDNVLRTAILATGSPNGSSYKGRWYRTSLLLKLQLPSLLLMVLQFALFRRQTQSYQPNRSPSTSPSTTSMMNTQWTAQDVERFREQQRWRLRQKSHMKQQPYHAPRPSPPFESGNNDQATAERTRKVSLKFRREHQHFLAKGEQNPHLSALAVTMRPTFTIATPFSKKRESPLPHMGHSMFNAFDSTASPEAFALERGINQDEDIERSGSLRVETDGSPEDHDMDMGSDSEEDHRGQQQDSDHGGSLWRRRVHVPGVERRSPKLGQVALWDAPSAGNNYYLMNLPLKREALHPFASNYEDDL